MDNMQCEHTDKKTMKQCQNKAQYVCDGTHAYCMKHSKMSVFIAPVPEITCEELKNQMQQMKEQMAQLQNTIDQMKNQMQAMSNKIEWLEQKYDLHTFDYVDDIFE
jgi:hypothetical protein